MQADKIIKAVCDDCEISNRQICRNMGRSESFLASHISTGRIPTIKLMAEIANATGHDLILRNRETGNEIVIDPPERA